MSSAAVPADPGLRPALLDGAMGTALLARGLPQGTPPERWLVERPGEIEAVHRAHAGAGAEVLLTCTFNLAAPRIGQLAEAGLGALAARAVRAARAAAPGVRVAGALGPTGLCGPGQPYVPSEQLREAYRAAAEALAGAGVDLLWLETQWDAAEASVALAALRDMALPVVVTFVLRTEAGRLVAPDGTSAEALLLRAAEGGAAAAGVNCVEPGPALTALAGYAREHLSIPFVAKPSPGLPGAIRPPEVFAAALAPVLAAGVGAVGACCGATADHLRAVAAALGRA
ncbi:MAG: homocysteine S-methyltransferase family protein [Anaeromyxobacter sp.]